MQASSLRPGRTRPHGGSYGQIALARRALV